MSCFSPLRRGAYPGLSITLSLTALVSFLVGALLGGRIKAWARGDSHFRFAAQAFLLEVVVTAASLCGMDTQAT
jgi:hypothetical protein